MYICESGPVKARHCLLRAKSSGRLRSSGLSTIAGLWKSYRDTCGKTRDLTERQFILITRQQERHLRAETARDWARYLKEAGLGGLRQQQNGGTRR